MPVNTKQVYAKTFSSKSNEYYTPAFILHRVRETFWRNDKQIDLDPASCELANRHLVRAKQYYTKEDNGLSKNWHGYVWCNPPRGTLKGRSVQGIWADKMLEGFLKGYVKEGILLARAVIGYAWFKEAWLNCSAICFLDECTRYYVPNDAGDDLALTKDKDSLGTALFYYGSHEGDFISNFKALGICVHSNYLSYKDD